MNSTEHKNTAHLSNVKKNHTTPIKKYHGPCNILQDYELLKNEGVSVINITTNRGNTYLQSPAVLGYK
jgi:hypothetical protein